MIISEINDDWDQHGEGLILVGLENVEEVIVLEEAHSSVGHLQVDTSNASHDSLEELGDKMLYLVDFANLKHLLKFSEEESFLNAVGERPVLKETLKERNGESSVLGEEEHRATKELLIKLRAGLDLVQGDDNVFEEDNVLFTKRHCETRNN